MLKIQYGIAGFFIGAFIGLLIGLVEMRFIDSNQHSAMLFIIIALTIFTCGIIGIMKALKMAKERMK